MPKFDVTQVTGEKNPRGIPSVEFIDSVEEFLTEKGVKVEPVIEVLNELHSKYKFMERQLTTEKAGLIQKLPEIKKTLETVEFLKKKKEDDGGEITTQFNLADNVYAKATVDTSSTETVCLWLGANVMVEYTYPEALTLLGENLSGAEGKLGQINEDLDFLRTQIITSEVCIARLFNHDVKERRKLREGGGPSGASEKK